MAAGKTVAYGYAVIRPQLSSSFKRVLKSQMKAATTGLADELSKDFGKKLSNGLRRTVERQADQNVGRFLKQTAKSLAGGSDIIAEAAERGFGTGLEKGIGKGSKRATRAMTETLEDDVTAATQRVRKVLDKKMPQAMDSASKLMSDRFDRNLSGLSTRVRKALDSPQLALPLDFSADARQRDLLQRVRRATNFDNGLSFEARRRAAEQTERLSRVRRNDLFIDRPGVTSSLSAAIDENRRRVSQRVEEQFRRENTLPKRMRKLARQSVSGFRSEWTSKTDGFRREWQSFTRKGLPSPQIDDRDVQRAFSKLNRSIVKNLDPELIKKATKTYQNDLKNNLDPKQALNKFRRTLVESVPESARRSSKLFGRFFKPDADGRSWTRNFLSTSTRALTTGARTLSSSFVGSLNRFMVGPLQNFGRSLATRFRAIGQTASRALTRGLAIATVAGGIGAFLFSKSSVEAASDYEQAIIKVNATFKNSNQLFKDFAETSASTWGIAKSQALEFAGTYGNLLQSFGISEQQASGLTLDLIQRAADIASFNNVPIEEVLTAIRSGLSGEIEPLKRFGITVSQMRLEDVAMQKGLVDKRGPLAADIKALAAYEIIMKDSTIASGDFQRSLGSMEIELKRLKALFTDFKTAVGEALIPTVVAGASVAEGLLASIQQPIGNLFNTIGLNLVALVGRLTPTFTSIINSLIVLFEQILPPIMNVVSMGVEAFGSLLEQLVPKITPIIVELVNTLSGILTVIGPPLLEVIDVIVTTGLALILNIARALEPVLEQVATILRDVLSSVLPPLAAALTTVFNAIAPVIPQLLEPIGRAITALVPVFEPLSLLLVTFAEIVGEIGGVVLNAFADAITSLAPTLGELINKINEFLPGFIELARGVLERLLPAVSGIASAIFAIVEPLIPVILDLAESLKGILGETLVSVANAVRDVLVELSPLITSLVTNLAPIIESVIGGIAEVVQKIAEIISEVDWEPFVDALTTVFDALGEVLPSIVKTVSTVLIGLSPIISSLIEAFGTLVEATAPLIEGILKALTPILPVLAQAFIDVFEAMEPLIPLIAEEYASLIRELTPVILDLVTTLVNELVPVIPELTLLFTDMIREITPFIPLLIQSSTLLLRLAIEVLPTLLPILVYLIERGLAPLYHWFLIVKGIVEEVAESLREKIATIREKIDSFVGFVTGLPERIKGALSGLWDFLSENFKTAINTIIRLWNGLRIPSLSVEIDIPFIGRRSVDFPDIDFPDITELANGGVITEPTIGLMGETAKARPEIVTPERLMRSVFEDVLSSRQSGQIVNNFQTNRYSVSELADEVAFRQARQLTGRQR